MTFKHTLRFIVCLVIIVGIVMIIRTCVLTPFQVKGNSPHKEIHNGSWVLLNKLERQQVCSLNQWVIFESHHKQVMGKVVALPGDTIRIQQNRYRIPLICCTRCGCDDCKLYLVQTLHDTTLVHQHQMLGKAYLIAW